MKVLIVDDDDAIREALSDALECEGHEVDVACNGADALERLGAGSPPDAVLLDLMMPVMDGWEFLERQCADPRFSHIAVVVITAMGSLSRPVRARATLHKPFGIGTLLELLDRLRASPRPEQPSLA